ncbi:multi-copper polyphenol oxidoreductase [Lysobacteraceae bacterium NML95-0200]|nr:multi-copper polyphenol oxidoreductase [Xanthomonadaceae bacterium NML95-0200]
MQPWIEANWPAPPGVVAITTTRSGAGVSQAPFATFNMGSRSGDAAAAVMANRRQLQEMLGLPGAPHWLHQVHGVQVTRIDTAASDEPQADAAVTAVPGQVLAILTADCLPVVLAARDGSEIAAAHAGWRGLAAGVLEGTLATMQTAPQHLRAWLGPAASARHYEIGAEVREAFIGHDAAAAACFAATRPGHWKVDLYALARQRLIASGMSADAIYGGEHCTIEEHRTFYSYRRDGHTGRMATLVWMH